MFAGVGTLGLSFLAGVLSTLSPCVLPLLPILIGSAVSSHRHGPLALALGLGLSFTLAGVALAALGLYLGLNQGWLRDGAAVVLIMLGAVLLSTGLQARFAQVIGPLGAAGNAISQRFPLAGLPGQFALGLLLGLVWAPCVGPTLGAAVTLASRGDALPQVALVMFVFGVGAAMPLALFGTVSRDVMLRIRGKLMRVGSTGKYVFGVLMIAVGASILTGFDKSLEAQLVQWSPDWLTDVTTRF